MKGLLKLFKKYRTKKRGGQHYWTRRGAQIDDINAAFARRTQDAEKMSEERVREIKQKLHTKGYVKPKAKGLSLNESRDESMDNLVYTIKVAEKQADLAKTKKEKKDAELIIKRSNEELNSLKKKDHLLRGL